MSQKPSVLIISYVPPYNRQGYDLAESLSKAGMKVRLYQMDGVTDEAKKIFGIKCMRPQGHCHKLQMVLNAWKFLAKTIFAPKQVVICVGRPMLFLGGLYSILFGSKLIWYSLEYSHLGKIDKFVYKYLVKGYIDVEENRKNAIFAEYGGKKHFLVCHNMPHLHDKPIVGRRLRQYLKENYGLDEAVKLVVYAGSYQKYACLECIIEASRSFADDLKLILMTFALPDKLNEKSSNCFVVPPVRGEEFYEWLADADVALLPYESMGDFNVLNCSPQKLFDCYVVGVPYVASDRPLVRDMLVRYEEAGCVCDFKDGNDIRSKIDGMINCKSHVTANMRNLHLTEFNYGRNEAVLLNLVVGVS